MNIAVWWIRRDLRLDDNHALHTATLWADQIIPLFVVDPRLMDAPNRCAGRRDFLFDGLHRLHTDLLARNSRLLLHHGDPVAVLPRLIAEIRAHLPQATVRIYAETDYSPYAKTRDTAVAAVAPLQLVSGPAILAPGAVVKEDGSAYTVYTPYSRRWKATLRLSPADIITAPTQLHTPSFLAGDELPAPAQPGHDYFSSGEAEAARRLAAFSTGAQAPIYRYATDRDRPDLHGTSQLSPHLRFGMISARRAALAAQQAEAAAPNAQAARGPQVWLDELIWRDFYITILDRFPHVHRANFRSEYDNIRWNNDEAAFAAWCEGRTGYPFVDAAMRQLRATGWMHNRARMVVASFLVKDLLIDWRWGERWFMQHLLDGDPAANNGGWQWAAGTGTDAAPYFRIFNPVNQGEKFDPQGDYVRRWVPELAGMPSRSIHAPWRLSPADQTRARCLIGRDYPAPIVDHQLARTRALETYKQALARA